MPSIRQRFHLSPCSDFRSHFSFSRPSPSYTTSWDSTIDVHPMTVLIGENDSGKSATLDAISIFFTHTSGAKSLK